MSWYELLWVLWFDGDQWSVASGRSLSLCVLPALKIKDPSAIPRLLVNLTSLTIRFV